ncbi:MAG: erythromycin esterase family protein [Bacteroidota bacterium]
MDILNSLPIKTSVICNIQTNCVRYIMKHYNIYLFLATFLFVSSCFAQTNGSKLSVNKVLKELSNLDFDRLIIPINSAYPSSNTSDIASLSASFSDKSIVALGESTHGTSEFVTLRHRMINYMVEHLNFRVIAIEANFSAADSINEYILGGQGSAKSAVKSIKQSWVYDNQEFFQLVEWLREFNNGQPAANKVTFYGFDAQNCEPSAKRVQTYVSQYAPLFLSIFDSTSKHFQNDFDEYFTKYSEKELLKMLLTEVADFQNQWKIVSDYFQTNKAELISKSGEHAYELTLRHWEMVKQLFVRLLYIEDELKSFNHRDSCMADNVDWISKFENKKMILWGHVGHTGSDNSITTQMGYHLKQRHQANYYTVGFFTNGGTVRVIHIVNRAPVLGEVKIKPLKKHVITQAFSKGNWSQFFLPMSAINANTGLKALFEQPMKVYYIGSTMEKSTIEQKLCVEYDAIIFIDKTTAAKP